MSRRHPKRPVITRDAVHSSAASVISHARQIGLRKRRCVYCRKRSAIEVSRMHLGRGSWLLRLTCLKCERDSLHFGR